MAGEEKSRNGNRWWEFYFIRYAMGSVVGGLIVLAFLNADKELVPYLMIPDAADFGWPHLVLYFGLGVAYCYIASGPVLVFHASRVFLDPASFQGSWLRRLSAVLGLYNLSVATACLFNSQASEWEFVFWVLVYALMYLFLVPYYLLAWRALVRNDEVFSFYKKLVTERVNNQEVLESYRHLREHGNSFFIVFFEMLFALYLMVPLGFIDFALGKTSNVSIEIPELLVAVIIWVIPSVLVWLIASTIEYRVAEGQMNAQSTVYRVESPFRKVSDWIHGRSPKAQDPKWQVVILILFAIVVTASAVFLVTSGNG